MPIRDAKELFETRTEGRLQNHGGVAEESLFHMAEWLNCPRNAGAPMGMPSGDADSNKRGGIGGGEVSAPGMFNSPIVLGGNMWKSMDPTKGLKNLGDSALKFNAGEALKNMGDSAMNFNPVDSMKQLGQSASNFGESARKFNPAKDSLDLLPKATDAAPGKSTPEPTPKGMDISSEKSARLGRLIGERKTPSSRAGRGPVASLTPPEDASASGAILGIPWIDRDHVGTSASQRVLSLTPRKHNKGSSDDTSMSTKLTYKASVKREAAASDAERPATWSFIPEKLKNQSKAPDISGELQETLSFLVTSSPSVPNLRKDTSSYTSSSAQSSNPSSAQRYAPRPHIQRSFAPTTAPVASREGAGGGMARRSGIEGRRGESMSILTEIGDIVEEIRQLKLAFKEEGLLLTTSYSRCVKDWQQARLEVQNAKMQLAGGHALPPQQDIEALCSEVENLCNQLETARAEAFKQRQRREEAEDLLRKVNTSLANHITADKIRNEEEAKQIRDMQIKLDAETQHRKLLEDELERSKVQGNRPSSLDAKALLNLQKELLAETETRRGLEKSLLLLKESYAEQERLRAKEAQQQETDMLVLRVDLQHERKLREATEDEMRRMRSVSISGEHTQRALLAELLKKSESDQLQLRSEKEQAEGEARRLELQLAEVGPSSQRALKQQDDVLKNLQRELAECNDKLQTAELAHQEARRRCEEAEKDLAISCENLSTSRDEKSAAIREAARLKIQLEALKPDYEAECVRSENARKENVRLKKELAEVQLSLQDLTEEVADLRAKHDASEQSLSDLRSVCALQAESESNISKQNERRERELERLRQDVEHEKKLKLRAEESMQQLREELAAADDRHVQKTAMLQRELETLRREVEHERTRMLREATPHACTQLLAPSAVESTEPATPRILLVQNAKLRQEVSDLNGKLCNLEREKSAVSAEKDRLTNEFTQQVSRLTEQLRQQEASAERTNGTSTCDVSGGGLQVEQLKTDLAIQKREVAKLTQKVEALESSLAAAGAEKLILLSRIKDLSSVCDGKASTTGIILPGGGIKSGSDCVPTHDQKANAIESDLEEERKKWDKERSDMQEQIRKLLQACMEEERESEMARKREASAREQLARLNAMVHGGVSATNSMQATPAGAAPSLIMRQQSSTTPKTPAASQDSMHSGNVEEGDKVDWVLTPEAHMLRGAANGGSYAPKHVESMKSMFEGSKVSGKGKVKEEIDTSSADNPAKAPEKQLSFV